MYGLLLTHLNLIATDDMFLSTQYYEDCRFDSLSKTQVGEVIEEWSKFVYSIVEPVVLNQPPATY